MSTVRMAYFPIPAVHLGLTPTVRLAIQDKNVPRTKPTNPARPPALLVSYVFLEPFLQRQSQYVYRDWALDSGAFSARNSGVEISLDAYIETCQRLRANDPTLTEIFALDVIGDWRASRANTEAMWNAGVPAIPCYHHGEPFDVLLGLAREYPKIAIGGITSLRGEGKLAFIEQCFARVWPKRIHGFGIGSESGVFRVPFHSVDATNWEIGPCKFGHWEKFGNLSVRGSKQHLGTQITHYLDLEERARVRWAKEMRELAALDTERKVQ